MFFTSSSEDDVIRLRSSLSDIKFIAQESLRNSKDMSEQVKSIFDDIIKMSDIGMYKPKKDDMQRAKQAFSEKHDGCCGEDK